MPEWDEIGECLRNALRPQEPPPEFATRIARLAVRGAARHPRPRRTRWPALAATLCLAVVLGILHYRHVQRERAAQQLAFAIRFTQARIDIITARAMDNALRSLLHD